MTEITMKQKKLLEPFGQLFAGMDTQVRDLTDDKLKELLAACYAASTTNCWSASFRAAQYLQREIRTEINQRNQIAANAAKAKSALTAS